MYVQKILYCLKKKEILIIPDYEVGKWKNPKVHIFKKSVHNNQSTCFLEVYTTLLVYK